MNSQPRTRQKGPFSSITVPSVSATSTPSWFRPVARTTFADIVSATWLEGQKWTKIL